MLVSFSNSRVPARLFYFLGIIFLFSFNPAFDSVVEGQTVFATVQQAARHITISMAVTPIVKKGASPAGTAEHCRREF